MKDRARPQDEERGWNCPALPKTSGRARSHLACARPGLVDGGDEEPRNASHRDQFRGAMMLAALVELFIVGLFEFVVLIDEFELPTMLPTTKA